MTKTTYKQNNNKITCLRGYTQPKKPVKSHQKCRILTAMFEFDIKQKLDEKTKKIVKGSKGWSSDI